MNYLLHFLLLLQFLLLFLFPQIREPFVHLFKTIFQTLALPFQALLVKYGKPPAEKTGLGEE